MSRCQILSVGIHICSFSYFMSVTPEILLGTSNVTHVYLCIMHMHMNNMDSILSLCRVESHICSLSQCLRKLNFYTHQHLCT